MRPLYRCDENAPPELDLLGFEHEGVGHHSEKCSFSVATPTHILREFSSVNPEVKFLAPVIHRDRPPTVFVRTRTQLVYKLGPGDIQNLAVIGEPVAKFGVLAVKKEALVELFDWPKH